MVTKKKPIKVRRRILSNKRTKGGNKKQHSKKRRTKRTKNKIKGGAGTERLTKPRTISSVKAVNYDPPGTVLADAVRHEINLEVQKVRDLTEKSDAVQSHGKAKRLRPKEDVISFMLVDLHGSYEDKKEGTQTPNNEKGFEIGVGLRDDIMTWFFARYTNATPNIPSDKVLPIFLKEHSNWEKIFIGLKQMEIDYKMYYYKLKKKKTDITISCTNNENIEMALNFIDSLSVPFQEEIVKGIGEGGRVGQIYSDKCSGFPQAGSHENGAILERAGSQLLQDTACGCENATVQSNSWSTFIQEFFKKCTRFMYPKTYVDSKWHIAATLSAIESIPDSKKSIIKRKNQLFCLSYGNDPNMSITIFTKETARIHAFENYHLEELDADVNGLKKTNFFSYITHIDLSKGLDVTCIKIFYEQFENILQYFSTDLGYRNDFVKGNFEKSNIFFIDDINFILDKLFNLSQDELVSFYESCRGRPDAY